jgi:hypothetical protein
MLDKKEKLVMCYIHDNCEKGKARLFPAQEIIDFIVSKKHILSLSELDEIMIILSKENMLIMFRVKVKKNNVLCLFKNKRFCFLRKIFKKKRYASWVIIRTALLALLSFIIGIVLKAIFG